MNLLLAFVIILIAGITGISFFREKGQKFFFFGIILLLTAVTTPPAFKALTGENLELLLGGNWVTGLIPLRIDALSGWFILIINFIFVTGGFYGLFYLDLYSAPKNNLRLHYASFILLHASLLGLCVIQNALLFLVTWELMTLAAFVAVIFEHEKWATVKAGINFFIQSHISLLMTGFFNVVILAGKF